MNAEAKEKKGMITCGQCTKTGRAFELDEQWVYCLIALHRMWSEAQCFYNRERLESLRRQALQRLELVESLLEVEATTAKEDRP